MRSQSTMAKIEFNAEMKCFLVKGTGNVVHIVKFNPKPTCSCRPTRTCYHIAAVQRCIGTFTPQKKVINLTQLRRNKRPLKQRPGRKRPRIGDCDIHPAPDADIVDIQEAEVNAAPDADVNDAPFVHQDNYTMAVQLPCVDLDDEVKSTPFEVLG